MAEIERKLQRGDSFDPPVFCTVCRYEERQGIPHVCGLPVEGTAAWVDPRYEQIMMKRRPIDHASTNIGDVTQPKQQRMQTRRERFPNYNASVLGHNLTEEEFTRMATMASTFGPAPRYFTHPPVGKVLVEIRKDKPSAPIPLGPAPKMLMLLAKNPPHPDE